LFNKMVYN